jgi:membrane protease YdiL (CAAX protease family)
MSWIVSHPIVALSYGFLCLSVVLLWLPGNDKIPSWSFALLISIILGLISHQLELVAIIPIIFLALAVYYSQAGKTHAFVHLIAKIIIIVLSVGLVTHQFPGFHNLNVLDHVYISTNAIPFTLYLNYDKTVVGIIILGITAHLISSKKEWLDLFKQVMVKAPIVILLVLVAAFILKFLKFDPKIPHSIFIWAVTNLLFACMAEEAFFRAFLQKNLSLMMRKIKFGHYWALLIAAILFGLSHYAGGARYVILATLAGIGYGWVYLTTKRIEGSILTHFGLNLVHFLFFTYPALVLNSV